MKKVLFMFFLVTIAAIGEPNSITRNDRSKLNLVKYKIFLRHGPPVHIVDKPIYNSDENEEEKDPNKSIYNSDENEEEKDADKPIYNSDEKEQEKGPDKPIHNSDENEEEKDSDTAINFIVNVENPGKPDINIIVKVEKPDEIDIPDPATTTRRTPTRRPTTIRKIPKRKPAPSKVAQTMNKMINTMFRFWKG